MATEQADDELDYIIIDSGFGGSVSALRLTEKGYRVAVIEQGKRFAPEDLPRSAWNLRDYIWWPRMGLHGILAIRPFKDVVIFHGAGVGGGSLVYANTHLEPGDKFYADARLARLADWKAELALFYKLARRMLGTTEAPAVFESDRALKAVLDQMGTGDTFKKHTVGIYFGKAGEACADPFFDGEGPERVGCNFCGSCMLGCRVGAKNTLDRNYLYLAEKLGARIIPRTRAVDVRPTDFGYEVRTRRSGRMSVTRRRTLRARNVIFSAGVIGTLELLMRCRERGSLPRLSDRLGTEVRTNSESIQSVSSPRDVSEGIAISSGGLTPDGTQVEMVRYGPKAETMSILSTVHTGSGPLPRQLYFLAALLRHPLVALKQLFWPFGSSRGSAIVLAMQDIDNSMQLVHRRRWYWPFRRALTSDWGVGDAPPKFLPSAQEVTSRVARELDGTPHSVLPEVLLDTTTTAHLLGGCPMGRSAVDGVIDRDCRSSTTPDCLSAAVAGLPVLGFRDQGQVAVPDRYPARRRRGGARLGRRGLARRGRTGDPARAGHDPAAHPRRGRGVRA